MRCRRGAILVYLCWLSAPVFAQVPSGDRPPEPVIQKINIVGASVFTPEELARRYDLAEGSRLTRTTDDLGRAIRTRYHDDGYTFAALRSPSSRIAAR